MKNNIFIISYESNLLQITGFYFGKSDFTIVYNENFRVSKLENVNSFLKKKFSLISRELKQPITKACCIINSNLTKVEKKSYTFNSSNGALTTAKDLQGKISHIQSDEKYKIIARKYIKIEINNSSVSEINRPINAKSVKIDCINYLLDKNKLKNQLKVFQIKDNFVQQFVPDTLAASFYMKDFAAGKNNLTDKELKNLKLINVLDKFVESFEFKQNILIKSINNNEGYNKLILKANNLTNSDESLAWLLLLSNQKANRNLENLQMFAGDKIVMYKDIQTKMQGHIISSVENFFGKKINKNVYLFGRITRYHYLQNILSTTFPNINCYIETEKYLRFEFTVFWKHFGVAIYLFKGFSV